MVMVASLAKTFYSHLTAKLKRVIDLYFFNMIMVNLKYSVIAFSSLIVGNVSKFFL